MVTSESDAVCEDCEDTHDDGACWEEDVFRVSYECDNCGATFDESYPAKTEITKGMGRRLMAVDTTKKGDLTVRPDYIECPNCELQEHVNDVDREPLGGDHDE